MTKPCVYEILLSKKAFGCKSKYHIAFTPTNNQSIPYDIWCCKNVRPLYDLDHQCESVKLLPITVGGQKIWSMCQKPRNKPWQYRPNCPKRPNLTLIPANQPNQLNYIIPVQLTQLFKPFPNKPKSSQVTNPTQLIQTTHLSDPPILNLFPLTEDKEICDLLVYQIRSQVFV